MSLSKRAAAFVNGELVDFVSQMRRLLGARPSFWRWVPTLIPARGTGLASARLWSRVLLGRVHVGLEDSLLRLSSHGRTIFFPLWGKDDLSRLIVCSLNRWAALAILDQHDAARFLKPGMVVFDIGAYAGAFTMLVSELVGSSGRVIAIEPEQNNFDSLRKTIKANRLDNVTALQIAVGDRDGDVRLSLSEDGDHSAVLHCSDKFVTVPMRSIDSLVETNLRLTRLDFIRIDAEGMEPEILRGATRTIRRFRPRLSVSCYHLPDHRTLLPRVLLEIDGNYDIQIRRLARGLDEEMFAHPVGMVS